MLIATGIFPFFVSEQIDIVEVGTNRKDWRAKRRTLINDILYCGQKYLLPASTQYFFSFAQGKNIVSILFILLVKDLEQQESFSGSFSSAFSCSSACFTN